MGVKDRQKVIGERIVPDPSDLGFPTEPAIEFFSEGFPKPPPKRAQEVAGQCARVLRVAEIGGQKLANIFERGKVKGAAAEIHYFNVVSSALRADGWAGSTRQHIRLIHAARRAFERSSGQNCRTWPDDENEAVKIVRSFQPGQRKD